MALKMATNKKATKSEDAHRLAEIKKAQGVVVRKEAALAVQKEDMKAAKDALATAQKVLRETINDEQLPLMEV